MTARRPTGPLEEQRGVWKARPAAAQPTLSAAHAGSPLHAAGDSQIFLIKPNQTSEANGPTVSPRVLTLQTRITTFPGSEAPSATKAQRGY